MNTNRRGFTTVIVLSFFFMFISVVAAAPAEKMSVQGRLTNTTDGSSLTGTYSINFSLWDNPSAGTMQYNETLSVTTDTNGLYSVVLTPTDEAIFTDSLWMALKIDADPEMSPRMNLTTSPYAYQALDLQCTDCIGTTEISDDYVLLVGDTMGGHLDMANSYLVQNIGNAGTDFVSGGGLNLAGTLAVAGAGTHTISGTLNVASSGLFANSTHVGIGTTDIDGVFEVLGTTSPQFLLTYSKGDGDSNGARFSIDTDYNLTINTAQLYPSTQARTIHLASNGGAVTTGGDLLITGDVGIGTSSPNSTLQVAGNITPTANNTYSLGNSTLVWKDVYVGSSSLHIGGVSLSSVNNKLEWGGSINFDSSMATINTTSGKNLTVTSGVGNVIIRLG